MLFACLVIALVVDNDRPSPAREPGAGVPPTDAIQPVTPTDVLMFAGPQWLPKGIAQRHSDAHWFIDRSLHRSDEIAPSRLLPQAIIDSGFRYAPPMSREDGRRVSALVRTAGPHARRVIELVDGLVTVKIAPFHGRLAFHQGQRVLGRARVKDARHYEIQIRPDVFRSTRAAKTMLHELGHVVDSALVSEPLKSRLVGPRPADCGNQCSETERFANAFRSWATGEPGAPAWTAEMDRLTRSRG